MRLIRIEHKKNEHGMWYNSYGKLDPFIMRLTEGKSKAIPMDYDTKYRDSGLEWFSSVPNVELLKYWFSNKDIKEMLEGGYGIFEIKAEQVKVEDNEVLFTRSGIVYKREIELDYVLNR